MIKRIFLLLTILISLQYSKAEKVRIGELYYILDKNNKTAEITYQYERDYKNYAHLSERLVISPTVKYQNDIYDIVTIGESAFEWNNKIKSVYIPSSIREIKRSALSADHLKRVDIDDIYDWLTIKFHKFGNPISHSTKLYIKGEELEELIIPETFDSIGAYVLEEIRTLHKVNIPKSIKHIGTDAFNNCYGLKEVHVEDLEAWCQIKFDSDGANPLGCGYLYLNGIKIDELVIPDGITEILPHAFFNIKGIDKVVIPNSVKKIGERAFYFSRIKQVKIPNSVTHIGESAFCWCTEIEKIIIPSSVVEIGEGAVSWCKNLKELGFPEHLWDRWGEAFHTNRNLEILRRGNQIYRFERKNKKDD